MASVREPFEGSRHFIENGCITFFIDLESCQHKLSSDYSLTVCFSLRFLYIDGPSFLHTNLYKMSMFERSVTCSFFFQELYSNIDKNSGEQV